MPTSRNAKGIDILAYNSDCTHTISLQVKTLRKRAPVPLGKSIDRLLGDFWIIVSNVENTPSVFIMKPKEIHDRAHRGEKDGNISLVTAKILRSGRIPRQMESDWDAMNAEPISSSGSQKTTPTEEFVGRWPMMDKK